MSEAIDPLLLVKEFTEAFGLDWKTEPGIPDRRTLVLRMQLPLEELGELAHALAAYDKVEAVDALADIDYVLYGAMGAFGTYTLPVGFQRPNWTVPATDSWEEPRHDYEHGLVLARFTERLSKVFFEMSLLGVPGNPDYIIKSRFHKLDSQLVRALQESASVWNSLGLLKYREAAFREVHRANMSKLDVNGKPILNEAGRVVKSDRYTPPDIAKVIQEVDNGNS